MHIVDAMQRAKLRPYIFDTDLSRQQAAALRAVLEKQGVKSLVVPMSFFTAFGPAHPLHNADCLPESFDIHPLAGEPFAVQWPDVAMISFGCVEHRETRVKGALRGTESPGRGIDFAAKAATTLIAPGFGFVRRRPPTVRRGSQKETEVSDCLDVFIGYIEDDEFAAHFRVISNKFYYDYLGERKQLTGAANFHLFVNDIVSFAPNLIVTARTQRFLDGSPPGRPIKGFSFFDEYNRWSVAMERARADQGE